MAVTGKLQSLLVDLLRGRISNRNCPVRVMSRALKMLDIGSLSATVRYVLHKCSQTGCNTYKPSLRECGHSQSDPLQQHSSQVGIDCNMEAFRWDLNLFYIHVCILILLPLAI